MSVRKLLGEENGKEHIRQEYVITPNIKQKQSQLMENASPADEYKQICKHREIPLSRGEIV